jgi:hypothetical protein
MVPSFSSMAVRPKSEYYALAVRTLARAAFAGEVGIIIMHRPFRALRGAQTEWLHASCTSPSRGIGRPAHVPLGVLRVWNDEGYAPSSGVSLHPHKDFRIVTM